MSPPTSCTGCTTVAPSATTRDLGRDVGGTPIRDGAARPRLAFRLQTQLEPADVEPDVERLVVVRRHAREQRVPRLRRVELLRADVGDERAKAEDHLCGSVRRHCRERQSYPLREFEEGQRGLQPDSLTRPSEPRRRATANTFPADHAALRVEVDEDVEFIARLEQNFVEAGRRVLGDRVRSARLTIRSQSDYFFDLSSSHPNLDSLDVLPPDTGFGREGTTEISAQRCKP